MGNADQRALEGRALAEEEGKCNGISSEMLLRILPTQTIFNEYIAE